MQLSFDLKKTILSHFFVFVVVFCLSFFIEIEISQAIIYNPGETLNPACSPSDLNCDVRSGVNVPSGAGAGSLVYATSTDVYNTLSIGSNGQILKVKNGGLSWSNDEAIQAMGKAGGQTIIGGTEANNALVIQANSATLGNNDYSTAIKFKVGNNGVTEALTILNNGNININGDISMAGDIIPAADNVYSLGSPTKVWRDVYIGPGSLYVNGQKVLQTDDSDNVAITADINQSLLMKTFGTGDIELNPSGSGQILLKGDLRLSSDKRFVGTVNFDNLIFTENTISTRNLNGGISLTPNGMGGVYVTNGNFGIGTTSPAEKLDLVGNLKISGALMPAGSAGSSGQFLVSQGAGLAPLWISYNTTNWNTAYSWGNHTGLYDLLGTASSSLTTHETAYNHSLIATALQSELDPIWNSEKGTYALKSEIPTLSNLTVSSFATSTISQWVNNVGYTTLSSFSASTPLSYNSTSGIFSLAKSDSLTDGYLSSVDWNIFNSKIGTTTGDWLGSWQGKNSSDFAASTTISSQWATNGSDVSYGAGNVGIGTISPTEKLEIVGGNIKIGNNQWIGRSETNKIQFSSYGYISFYSSSAVADIFAVGGKDLRFGTDPTGATNGITFKAFNGANWREMIRINNVFSGEPNIVLAGSYGNVGVGTTTPSEKLDIAGNLKFSGSLMPGGFSGNSGQFLISQGAGVSPQWTTLNTTNWDTSYNWGNHASAGYTTLSSFSASTPLSYNSTSGIFSLAKSDSLTDGYLSSLDWNNFNSKIGTTIGNWLGSWQGKNSTDFAASTTISSQWVSNGSSIGYMDGMVGIGTTTPNQQLEITKNFRLPSTVGASRYGVIYKDDVPFIHDFAYGLNSNGITPEGNNTFIGRNSGNFTMGSTATSASQASYNLGIGAFSLQGNTLGTQNVGIGLSALRNNTTGVSNFALGGDSLFSNSTGSYNVGIGNNTLRSASLTNFNLGIGFSALRFITSGDNNIGIGYNAGRYISNGATTLTSSSGGIFIGTEARPLANNSSNEIVIGYNTVGLGSNTAVIGNSDITTTVLRGNIGVGITNPSFNLDITNTINVSSRYRINGQAYAYWNTTAPNLPSGMTAAVELGYAGVGPSSNFPTRLNANLNSYLQAYNNGTDTSFTFIGGNVGIGTTTPGMKLSVLATDSAKAMEIIGSSGGYANIDITGSRTSGNLGGLRFVRSGDAVGFFEMNPQANKSATYFSTGDGTVAPTVKLALLQNGNTGIGTVNPLSPLHISNIGTSSLSTTFSGAIGTQGSFISAKNGLNAIYNISADNGPANRPTMVFLRSRGTLTTPSNVAENDTLGDLLFGGIGGSSVNYGGGVFAYVDGTPTASSVPTRISFVTGGSAALRSERLVIKNDGKIGIGTTSPAYKLDVYGDGRFTTGLTIDSLGTGALYSNAGILTNTDPSDINLKQNILNINNSLSKIMSLRPVSFEWKNTGELSQGFIAQEVETILPELVGQNPGGYKGLYTTRFIPYIVSAIQEQQSLLQGQRSLLDSLSFDVSKSLNISSLNKLVLNGGLEVSGHVAFSEDTVGEVEILSGNLEMRINFKEEYLEKPIITVTPKSELAGVYWVSDVDAHGFTIKLKETQAENIAFYWHAFAKKGDFFPAPVIVPENNNSSESENIINAIEENSGAVNSESTPTPEPETLPEPVTASEPIPETIPAPEPEIAPAQASETENTPEPIQDVVTTPETINE